MYCGWQTRGSRLRWAAVVFLLVAFVALGIMYAVVSQDCVVCETLPLNFTGEEEVPTQVCVDYRGPGDLTNVERCNKAYVVGSFLGFVFSAILVTIPCVAMCCAASPADMAANERAMAARASAVQGKQAPRAATAPPVAPPVAPRPADPPQKSRFGFTRKAPKPPAAADPLSQPAF